MTKLMEEWIAALRSGKYTQTFGKLRQDDSFCAIGVLYDVYKNMHPGKYYWEPGPEGSFRFLNLSTGYYLSTFVDHPFGLCVALRGHDHGHSYDWLPKVVKHNDQDRLSFERIAEILEEDYRGDDVTPQGVTQ